MRILIFPKDFPSKETPGAGIFVLRRAQALRNLGHDVRIVRVVPLAPPLGRKWNAYHRIPRDETFDGIPVRSIRAIFPPRMTAMEYLPLQVHRALAREIADFSPDVLNASFLIPNGQIAVRQNVPVVVTSHGSDAYAWPYKRSGLLRAAREAVCRADVVTAVSQFIASCVQRISARDVTVIWNGADERFFFPRPQAPARERVQIANDRLVIAFAGNLLRAKGLYDLIDACASLVDLRPLLVFAGAGPERASLAEYAARAGVELQLRGRLGSKAVGELFSAADIVTLPSHNEGLPNVVCEAMLNGSAVVATTAGGTAEIAHDGETALLVPSREPALLAAALRRAAENHQLRAALGAGARAFALEHLTWSKSARGYQDAYDCAIEARRRRAPSRSGK